MPWAADSSDSDVQRTAVVRKRWRCTKDGKFWLDHGEHAPKEIPLEDGRPEFQGILDSFDSAFA